MCLFSKETILNYNCFIIPFFYVIYNTIENQNITFVLIKNESPDTTPIFFQLIFSDIPSLYPSTQDVSAQIPHLL